MDYKMISADDHLDLQYLPTDLWTKHLPKALRHRVPHIEERNGALSGSATAKSGDAGPAHADQQVQKRTSMRSTGARAEVYRLAQQGGLRRPTCRWLG